MAYKFNFERMSKRERIVRAGADRDIALLLDRYVINTDPEVRAIVHVGVLDLLVSGSTR